MDDDEITETIRRWEAEHEGALRLSESLLDRELALLDLRPAPASPVLPDLRPAPASHTTEATTKGRPCPALTGRGEATTKGPDHTHQRRTA